MASISARLMPSSAPRSSIWMPADSTAAISEATVGRGLWPITTTPMRWCFNGMFMSGLVLQDDEIGRRPFERDCVAGDEQAARACIGLLHEDAMAAVERDAVEHGAAEEVGVLDDAVGGVAGCGGGVSARDETNLFGAQRHGENTSALCLGGRQPQDQALADVERRGN